MRAKLSWKNKSKKAVTLLARPTAVVGKDGSMKCFVTSALIATFFPLALAGVLRAADATDSKSKPNIVFILADDLGINDLGCYGRNDHRTPNLDRLASQGMRFTCAYTAQPICSPSRAAIMTGKCPARLNLTNYLPGRPDAPPSRRVSRRHLRHPVQSGVGIKEPVSATGLQQGISAHP